MICLLHQLNQIDVVFTGVRFSFSFFTGHTKGRATCNAMKWHELQEPEFKFSGKMSVNFLLTEMKFSSSLRGIWVVRGPVKRVKMTETLGKIQWKLDLVRVSGEFELSGFYCLPIIPWSLIIHGLYFFSDNVFSIFRYIVKCNFIFRVKWDMGCIFTYLDCTT